MTVVLTGDVHQWINSADRAYSLETECSLALQYARIAGNHGLKVTLFFTGLAIAEDAASLDGLLNEQNVEVGGHGWDAFRPEWRYRGLNKIFGSPHGSRAMQARMVRRTCSSLEHATGRPVRSWRNHAYRFDHYTQGVLATAGIEVWSDDVDLARTNPYRHGGVTVLPINTTPDHENVYHGDQTAEAISAERQVRFDPPRAWCAKVERQTDSIAGEGGVATVLAHPLCMKVADDWTTFERLCAALSRYRSVWAIEAAELVTRDVQ